MFGVCNGIIKNKIIELICDFIYFNEYFKFFEFLRKYYSLVSFLEYFIYYLFYIIVGYF